MKSIRAKYRCPVCDSHVEAFQPLPQFYTDNLQKYGCPFKAEEAETCNYRNYSCPSCQASDRDRLYALYLRDYLRKIESGGVVKVIDFAPSAPLSQFIRKQVVLSG